MEVGTIPNAVLFDPENPEEGKGYSFSWGSNDETGAVVIKSRVSVENDEHPLLDSARKVGEFVDGYLRDLKDFAETRGIKVLPDFAAA